MIQRALKAIFGSRNDRLLKQYSRTVRAISALEPAVSALTDEQLAAKTLEFKDRVARGATLDELLPEAFAVVREAGKRVLNMRHFDMQLVGGMVLHNGKIAEMRTGEGKTLVGTLPAYLNALSGKGVHIVTVNDYLASRDSEWMGRLYRFLGLTVGVNLTTMPHAEKQAAYAADITYGTNNEFGFDYLRDNMAMSTAERYQRGLNFAIVDEVDSILIDEARTPLIISGQADDRTEVYYRMNEVAPLLKRQPKDGEPGDFLVDEKAHTVLLSEDGHENAEQLLGRVGLLPEGRSLYEPAFVNLVHHLNQALRAHHLYFRDRHYVVQEGEVIIVDEFTGRLMPGRRWSDGLHQAVEAKENVSIQSENQTLASITFQNYFRMYSKLSGMTGTADTEAYEFQEIYNLETVVIPTTRPMVRKDYNDQVFRTQQEKYAAIIEDVKDCYTRSQPVLVGTTSIENSELLSAMLQKESVPHQVLNAKQHAREAEIVAQAGRPKMITIATNMAGRGTDIVLGGNVEKQVELIAATENLSAEERERRQAELQVAWQAAHAEVVAAGGLHIIGTERHESRRIDNQLRGRSGRQGDPGSSRFYLSAEDPLIRIFGGDRMKNIMSMKYLKMPDGEPIEHPMVSRVLESSQRKVEAHNFDIRKQLLEFDNVANDQRHHIYELRDSILSADHAVEQVQALRNGVIEDIFRAHVPEESVEEQWDVDGLTRTLAADLLIEAPVAAWLESDPSLDDTALLARIIETAGNAYASRHAAVTEDTVRQAERIVLLSSIDSHWREHLAALDHLRQGIHLRGYAQKNPKQEYKREAFELFGGLLESVKREVTRTLMTVQIRSAEEVKELEEASAPVVENVRFQHASFEEAVDQPAEADRAAAQPFQRHMGKVGRNDPCPCGSGKKFKQCHGKLA
jgi:preprotein translocase subunit SecA